ncbi:MAG TPA: aminotransferase class V-fold PLP-dependent enzyme [Longimicrobiales bacterium]|nr:aminotransferase class V-fold PLP-dependent enzyme [Longimicrobiales bacterium]
MNPTILTAVQDVRAVEFPHLDECTFLNAASFGPLPRRTRAAVEGMLRMREEQPGRFAEFDFVEALERCRRAAASLIGASSHEIALGPNTSFGLYLAASLLPQACRVDGRAPQETTILVSDREFPANVLPWMGLRRLGFRLEIATTDERGFPREEALVERVGRGDVALLAVSSVQFASGYRSDLRRLGAACREAGTLFVVDAIQSAGALPIDVRACSIDILACGGQKWLCAPQGSGFAYVRRELCARLEPPLRGWLAVTSSEDFGSLLDYDAPLFDDARRFELGSPAIQDQLALAHSIELLLEVGVDNIEAHTREILEPLHEWIGAAARARLASPAPGAAASPITCVALPEPDAAFERLARARVVCALREGVLRFSPHLYNTRDEIDALVRILDEVA